MASKKIRCIEYGCDERPVSAGYCLTHYTEHEAVRKQRDDAVRFLHHGDVDYERLTDEELRLEAAHLWDRWGKVCAAVSHQRFTAELPADEAPYAVEWCIGLAKQIVEAERTVRAGKPKPFRSRDLWERFENLDKGLMSNGLPRKESR